MADRLLWLDPERARRGGVDLSLAGRAIQAKRAGLGARITAASAKRPWGRDDIGSAFEQTYRGLEATVLQAWDGLGCQVEELGTDAVRSVQANVETDAGNAARLGRVARQPRPFIP